MIEINLVPDIKQELLRAQRIRTRVIAGSILIGVVAIAIVTLLVIYVFTIQAIRSGLADASIKQGSDKLVAVTDLTKTLTIQNQLTKISALNSSKKIDSRIFDVLNAIIPPAPNAVQISNLGIDSSTGVITIDGQAANSYAAVEVFKKTIEGTTLKYTDENNTSQSVALASNISTSNTSYGEDTTGARVLRFTLSFTYVPELFSPASKNIAILITINGNVTDSFLGVPKSIFVDRAADITGGN
jgi:Tfp pilus assembly protein PilN